MSAPDAKRCRFGGLSNAMWFSLAAVSRIVPSNEAPGKRAERGFSLRRALVETRLVSLTGILCLGLAGSSTPALHHSTTPSLDPPAHRSTLCYTFAPATLSHLLHFRTCYTFAPATLSHLLHFRTCYTFAPATLLLLRFCCSTLSIHKQLTINDLRDCYVFGYTFAFPNPCPKKEIRRLTDNGSRHRTVSKTNIPPARPNG